MGRDYKNSGRRTARRAAAKPKQSAPGAIWFLAGLALGLGCMVAVHIYHVEFAPQMSVPTATAPPAATADSPPPAAESRPRFEFYKILPEMEVVVPEDEEQEMIAQPTPPPAPSKTPAPPAGSAERYLLQVASFQGYADADRLKAQLALLGLEASIQTVEIHGGQTWHRVRVGPYSDREEIASVRQRLKSNGIDAVLLKLSS